MADVTVKVGEVTLRTCKLTKSILNQIPRVHRLPQGTYDEKGNLVPEKVVGWLSGTVLGDKYSTIILFKLDEGDYTLYLYPGDCKKQLGGIKQLYIV